MSLHFNRLLPLILAVSAFGLYAADSRGAEGTYFRSDGGIAREPGSLPGDLDANGKLSWRTPVDPGHSTPIVNGGRLFLTTWKANSKQMATVALDAETGK